MRAAIGCSKARLAFPVAASCRALVRLSRAFRSLLSLCVLLVIWFPFVLVLYVITLGIAEDWAWIKPSFDFLYGYMAWKEKLKNWRSYGLYSVGVLALPMALPSERLGGLYSFPRFALVAFPCLVALAVLGRDRRVHVVTLAVLATALAVYVVRWALWYWVA